MIRTLRARLILSHTLPLLIILLLIGVSFDYLLETKILLPVFADELTNEANLLAELASDQPQLWENPSTAQQYLDRIKPNLEPFLSIIDAEGKLLASTDPIIAGRIGERIETVDQLTEAFENGVSIRTEYSRQLEANAVDVLVPAFNSTGQLLGSIHLTYYLENIYQQFLTLRYLISSIIGVGLLLGLAISLILAVNLGNALNQLGIAVEQIATSKQLHLIHKNDPMEIQKIYRAVNTVVSQLEDLEDKRQKLLANLVHELGRPLGGLVLAIQALQLGAGKDGNLRIEMLDGIEVEINILRRLLEDIEGLYGQTSGSFNIVKKPVALSPWFKSILRLHQESANAKGLLWEQDVPGTLPELEIDTERLAQAVGNLIDNAIKFTPSGGMVSVSVENNNKEVKFQVKDTGYGISIDEQENVFTPFWRGTSHSRFPQGLGLGLSIARDMVMAHRGELEFTSSPGEGSTFIILLPIDSI